MKREKVTYFFLVFVLEKSKLKTAPKHCFSGFSPPSLLLMLGSWKDPKSVMSLRHESTLLIL